MTIIKRFAAPILALSLGTLAYPALADQPGKDQPAKNHPAKDWMPMDQVVRSLEQAGFTNVTKLEADDGHWEGRALKDGRTVSFHADARTGTVTEQKVKEAKAKDGKADDGDDD